MRLRMTALPIAPRPLSATRRIILRRRIRWIVAATITYNVIEATPAQSATAADVR